MSNTMGKVLLSMKKAGEVVSKSASEVGTVVGVAGLELGEKVVKSATAFSDMAKKSAKVAMLKAEIDDMYKDLGKCVFNEGIVMVKAGDISISDEALAIMDILFVKQEELETLEAELAEKEMADADVMDSDSDEMTEDTEPEDNTKDGISDGSDY